MWVSKANYFRILEDFEGVEGGLEDKLEIDDYMESKDELGKGE